VRSQVPKARNTALKAVLFTDIVGSTELARELGDERWSRLLSAQLRIVREELRRNNGREVDTAGDGLFAVFDGPADAVRCAFAVTRAVQVLGLDVRAGVHFGEIETSGKQAHGIVVHTGARVMAQAGAAEVLVTQTVKDLVAGARFEVKGRGSFELKGVPGTWTLFDVLKVDEQLRPEPIGTATVASERRERASSGAPRRSTRRLLVPVAVIAAVVVIAGVVASRAAHPAQIPAPGTVARIDGARFDAPVRVGSFPLAMTEGAGRVWVLDRASQIYWVKESDDSTGSLGADGVPTGAAFGGGDVWITGGFGTSGGSLSTVSQLDPVTGQLTAAFQTPIDSQAIAFGAGSVWVANFNTGAVSRYDPVSHQTQTIRLPQGARPDSAAFGSLGGDAVWVGDPLSTNVYRIDASGSHSVRTYTVGGEVSSLAVGDGAVWVVSQHANVLYALDPGSGAVRASVNLASSGCSGPSSVAAGSEGVWVACSLSREVALIDPSKGAVTETLKVDGVPGALTAAQDGSVWVGVQPS
jgi:class 3 adenylate cyclase/streptogramin lyase